MLPVVWIIVNIFNWVGYYVAQFILGQLLLGFLTHKQHHCHRRTLSAATAIYHQICTSLSSDLAPPQQASFFPPFLPISVHR